MAGDIFIWSTIKDFTFMVLIYKHFYLNLYWHNCSFMCSDKKQNKSISFTQFSPMVTPCTTAAQFHSQHPGENIMTDLIQHLSSPVCVCDTLVTHVGLILNSQDTDQRYHHKDPHADVQWPPPPSCLPIPIPNPSQPLFYFPHLKCYHFKNVI